MAEIGSYLYISKRDLQDATLLFKGGSYTQSGRLSEQVVEKVLKHHLHTNGTPEDYRLLYTHKPFRLYKKCQECGFGLELSKDQLLTLKDLDSYYYDTNYPGNDFFELDHDQAQDALNLAKIFMDYSDFNPK